MRPVAVLLLLVTLGAAMPAVAGPAGQYDECNTLAPCVTHSANNKVYYAWGGFASCVGKTVEQCLGRPGPLVVGVVYEESNRLGGLQRSTVTLGSTTYLPDKTVLI